MLISWAALWTGSGGGTPLTWCPQAYMAYWSQMWARRSSVYPSSCKVNAPGMNRWRWTRPDCQVNRGSMEVTRCAHCRRRCSFWFLLSHCPYVCDSYPWLESTSLGSCLFISWMRDTVIIPCHTFSIFSIRKPVHLILLRIRDDSTNMSKAMGPHSRRSPCACHRNFPTASQSHRSFTAYLWLLGIPQVAC